MRRALNFWLDWENKVVRSKGLKDIEWNKLGKFPLTVYCDEKTWPWIGIEEKIAGDQEQRTYQIGLATIKELRGGSEKRPEGMGSQALKMLFQLEPNFIKEHPSLDKETFEEISGWVFPPRFEVLQSGVKVEWKIDFKSFYANIMKHCNLPKGELKRFSKKSEIEKKIKAEKTGLVRFKLNSEARIKAEYWPFIPNIDNEIKARFKGKLLLYSKLFFTLRKYYKLPRNIEWLDFWEFEESKGKVDKFLKECEKISESDLKRGKMLRNALYGVLGKKKFGGYNYRVWTIAVNHLAIKKVFELMREFKKEQLVEIRSDCISGRGKIPRRVCQNKNLKINYEQN